MKEIPFKQRFERWAGLQHTQKQGRKAGTARRAGAKAPGQKTEAILSPLGTEPQGVSCVNAPSRINAPFQREMVNPKLLLKE